LFYLVVEKKMKKKKRKKKRDNAASIEPVTSLGKMQSGLLD
jgi:hypothetical protein